MAMELGTVEHFDGRPNKQFGFIKADRDGASVFFHLNNESYVRVDEDSGEPHWDIKTYKRIDDMWAQKGQRVLFERVSSANGKGPKVSRWSYAIPVERDFYHGGKQRLKQLTLRMVEVGGTVLVTFNCHPDMHHDSLFGTFHDRLRRLLENDAFFVPVDRADLEQVLEGASLFHKTTFEFRRVRERTNDHSFDRLLIGSGLAFLVTLGESARKSWAEWYEDPLAPSEALVWRRNEEIEDSL